MKPKLYLFLILALSLFAFSCRTAKKMYEKGNYDEAVELAAKKLQKKPDDPKLISLIREAYRFAEEDHQANIHSFAQSNNELKWEWIYNEYASLQRMYDAIYKVPSIFELVDPVDHSGALITYAEKAGDVRFDRGMYFMDQGDKASFRKAYREFQLALGFKPGHRDISLKLDEAYDLAVTNVIVLPIHQYGGYVYSGYTPGGMNFDDQLIRDLQFNGGSEFTRFYSAWDARSQGIRPDLEMEMNLVRFDLGRPQEIRSNRRVSKEVLVKETVYRPDSVVKEYAKVIADIHTTRRTQYAEARLDLNIRRVDGSWIWSDHMDATRSWSNETVSFTGDQRALSDQDRQLLNNGNSIIPHESDITRDLLDELSRDAVYRVRNYFVSTDY
jgi:tetratricopeptide (TPR) repeat protein